MATAMKKYVDDAMPEPVDVMSGGLFDHIDDLLDFPNDDDVLGMVDPHGGPAPAPSFAPLLPPLEADDLLSGGGGRGHYTNGSVDVAGSGDREVAELGPCDDIDMSQLEWLSNFFDDNDSFTLDLPQCTATATAAAMGATNSSNSNSNGKEDSLFRTSSPVSVLEPNSHSIGGSGGGGSSSSSSSSFSSSSSSCSGTGGGSSGARALEAPPVSHPEPVLVVPARARSKRPRPATFSARPHVTIPFLPPSSGGVPVYSSSSDPESFGESSPSPAPMMKKKKKKSFAAIAAGGDEAGPQAPPARKCMHCEIQKTPQWRAGPMGPKTLCNACGVRYKSGRLFPEYRPAASPTFVPSVHSNSHKKVVELRIKASQKPAAAGMLSPESAAGDSCDLLAYIRRRV
ncbi:GATA transcription factor 4-like [Phoenix dactylifera]|uniref:GATA transcription factor 4-like n=1 Tax=Phoenix dactylifera TaxID=42345 RepID=A0A8B7CRZ1_PHODC|nr:GATA transcription factor 4-like [Phoenix dactylifera]XP_008805203.2 GATA transcription factor 4-like [Phoenix dactylifera]